MPKPEEIGRLEKVAVREVLPHEAAHFTPWLAVKENLEPLSEVIGLQLEPDATEVAVEEFSADLVCQCLDDGSTVLVENQYGPTDHDHLGKILTYTGGLKASTLIWIAEEFRPAHRAALDWLNENSVEGVNFFGVEIEFWRIGASLPAPRFNLVCQPNDWSKTLRETARKSRRPLTPDDHKMTAYWDAVVERIGGALPTGYCVGSYGHSHSFWVYRSWDLDFWFTFYVTNKADLGLFCRFMRDKGERLFLQIRDRHEDISGACGHEVTLQENYKKQTFAILASLNAHWSDQSDWAHQHDWYGTTAPAFMGKIVEILEPFIDAPEVDHQ